MVGSAANFLPQMDKPSSFNSFLKLILLKKVFSQVLSRLSSVMHRLATPARRRYADDKISQTGRLPKKKANLFLK